MKKKDELKILLEMLLLKLDGFEDRIKKLEEVSHKQATLSDMEENARKVHDEYKKLSPDLVTFFPFKGPLGGVGTVTGKALNKTLLC